MHDKVVFEESREIFHWRSVEGRPSCTDPKEFLLLLAAGEPIRPDGGDQRNMT